jgi:Zn ribbon nucleic-acid-binding protein
MTSSLPPVWRDYRSRRRLFAAAIVGFVPVLAWSTKALPELTASDAPGHVLLAAWITAFVGAAVRFASFRCPFCGDHFHWTLWVANPFSDECLHCGFRRWRDPHAARAFARR